MASTTNQRKKSRSSRRWLWITGAIVLIAILVGGWLFSQQRPLAEGELPEGWQAIQVEQGSIDSTVSATGNVESAAEANLRFEVTGNVVEIMIEPGDTVREGNPLAKIDTTDLELLVAQAEADLRQAQADYEGLLEGATEAELAEARIQIDQARSQYEQTLSSVTDSDIAAARSDLERAQARLARLQGGPDADELAQSNDQVTSARTALEQSRVDLSAAKEQARLDVETRANALRNAQDEYSRVYWENRELEDQLASFGRELPREDVDREEAALRSVADAEAALDNAKLAYEKAKQDEITTLEARESALASAIASHDALLEGVEEEDLADARAAVERAEAQLQQLLGANRASSLAVQQSNIASAETSLKRLLEPPSESSIAAREAGVVRAEVALRQAQRNLDLGTLRAPFAATITRVDLRIGEPADGDAIIAVADLSNLHIDLPIDELDIAQIRLDQPVRISLDALPDVDVAGSVAAIAPIATSSDQGTTTYEVTVTLGDSAVGVRPGMTAVVDIITDERENVVLAPRRAVRSEGGVSYVLIPNSEPVPPGNSEPPGEQREVTIGLSNSQFVEILNGLQAGDEVLVQDVVSTFLPGGGPPDG